MNQVFSVFIAFLSSKNFLDYYLKAKKLDINEINEELFTSQRVSNSSFPNQIYNNSIIKFNQKGIYSALIKSFDGFQTFFQMYNNELYIKKDYFSNWQNALTYLNPLPLIVYYLYKNKLDNKLETIFSKSSLPTIQNDFLQDKKFRELHIHINGTSESIFNWLHFLKNQKIIYDIVKDSYRKNNMQFRQLGIMNQRELSQIIEKASVVREYLQDLISDNKLLKCIDFEEFQKWENYLMLDTYTQTPYKQVLFLTKERETNLLEEAKLWYGIFEILEDLSSESEVVKDNLAKLVHYYILSMSLFNRFLVQQSDQNGFSQFQLITDNELRDAYEDMGFNERYLQLFGLNGKKNDLKHLELRFAPKKTVPKMVKLYKRIILDWRKNCKEKKVNYSISTVAHFIKQKDMCVRHRFLSCGYADLRKNLQKQADTLISMFESSRTVLLKPTINYLNHFSGIDAAGNELYARPEVFAPVFDYLNKQFEKRFSKKLNLTFHAGEDYVHLLSGIRYVWEAIHFLGMDESDKWRQCRIGHATALGIEPQFWADKLDGVIVMSKGEWLDSMIFIQFFYSISKYFYAIERLWKEIYGISFKRLKALEAYENRKENPYECEDEIVKLYNSPEVVEKYNEMIEVSIDKRDIEIMTQLQRKVLKLMKDNKIAIESMITSNVRISYYDKYEQHHIYRWLFPEGAEEDIVPPIVLASDDPGLFNNNMRIEFSHLYEILKKKGIHESEIETKINELQENANTYTFK